MGVFMMKKTMKYVLGTAAILGTVAVIKVTKKGVEKTTESINKLKFKLLVRDKLNDNPGLLDLADDLADDEIRVLIDVLERLDDNKHEEHFGAAVKSKIASAIADKQ